MSNTRDVSPSGTARAFGTIAADHLVRYGQRKSRGDTASPTDPVRRLSYHEDTRQAQPWIVHGGGSRQRWNKHKAAVLGAHDALARKQRLKEGKARRAGVDKRDRDDRLRPGDRNVLAYLLDRYNHVTGWLFPAIETIETETGWSHGFCVDSLQRLWKFGFLRWVRRTKTKEGAEGQAGPQLEQTSNAYFFDWASTLVADARATYINLLTIGLKKLGARSATAPTSPPTDPALAAELAALDAAVRNRDADAESASP